MCGIAGIFRPERDTTVDDARAVLTMANAQRHRGPDDDGFYQDVRVALGHRRLSVIDVTPSSRQPMSNENGSVWVVYNGEIYNYQVLREELRGFGHVFRSLSDTEVIVHGYEQWGIEGLLEKIRGMFGIALYDSGCASLFLARDRFGIKPIYYIESSGSSRWIAFASETKALLAAKLATGEWDSDAVAGFLLFGSVPTPRTTFRDVRCLLPGHYLMVERHRSVMRRYWDLSCLRAGQEVHAEKQAVPALRRTLKDAVRRHLVSDVPLGLFLSGGMDSVGLLAEIARLGVEPLTTLTVAFDEKGVSESEGEEARKIALRFGTDHREIVLRNEDFTADLPTFLAAMDQPTIDGLNTYFISKAARSAGLVVVLSGLGGDEVFWGYKYYQWFRRYGAARLLKCLPSFARSGLLKSLVAYGGIAGQERWLRLSALCDGLSSKNYYRVARGFFAPEQVSRLLGLESLRVKRVLDECLENGCGRTGEKAADAAGFNHEEMKRYLHDTLLRDTDVYSMAHSIEVRVPYLDHEVVSLAAEFDGSEKLRRGINKPLLAEVIDDPQVWDSARRRKRGFALPMDKWIHGSLDQLFEMQMGTAVLEKAPVREILESFRARRLHWSRVWSVIALGAHAAGRCAN